MPQSLVVISMIRVLPQVLTKFLSQGWIEITKTTNILGIFALMGTICRKVALQEIRFFAFHGYYPGEQVIGSEFLVDVEASWEVAGVGKDELSETLNYERLFSIVSEQMKAPRKLIETVAHAILDDIRNEFASLQIIRVAISKKNPPLAGEVKSSLVELTYTA